MWKGLGAEVYAYDPFPSDFAKQYCEFVSEHELLATCDIVSVHVPYFKGKNDQLINAEYIAQMKDGAVLVNTARGELADEKLSRLPYAVASWAVTAPTWCPVKSRSWATTSTAKLTFQIKTSKR